MIIRRLITRRRSPLIVFCSFSLHLDIFGCRAFRTFTIRSARCSLTVLITLSFRSITLESDFGLVLCSPIPVILAFRRCRPSARLTIGQDCFQMSDVRCGFAKNDRLGIGSGGAGNDLTKPDESGINRSKGISSRQKNQLRLRTYSRRFCSDMRCAKRRD